MSDCATKEDVLGAEDIANKPAYSNITNIFSSRSNIRNATVFSLGGRETLISVDFLSPLIVPSAAQQAGELVRKPSQTTIPFQHTFESIFRSIQYALVDHCSHEFLFLCDFFIVDGQSAVDLFTVVMTKSISQLLVRIAFVTQIMHYRKTSRRG